jgi:hypothetical protein
MACTVPPVLVRLLAAEDALDHGNEEAECLPVPRLGGDEGVVVTAQDGAQRPILCAAVVVDLELPWPGRILLLVIFTGSELFLRSKCGKF